MYVFYVNNNDITVYCHLDVKLNKVFGHKIIICPVFMGIISKFLGWNFIFKVTIYHMAQHFRGIWEFLGEKFALQKVFTSLNNGMVQPYNVIMCVNVLLGELFFVVLVMLMNFIDGHALNWTDTVIQCMCNSWFLHVWWIYNMVENLQYHMVMKLHSVYYEYGGFHNHTSLVFTLHIASITLSKDW